MTGDGWNIGTGEGRDIDIEAVAQGAEDVEAGAGLEGRHQGSPLPDELVEQGQDAVLPVAYGYGAAQEEAVELDVHELARTLLLAAAGQLHLIDLRQHVNRPV